MFRGRRLSSPTIQIEPHDTTDTVRVTPSVEAVEKNIHDLSVGMLTDDALLARTIAYQLGLGGSRVRATFSLRVSQQCHLPHVDCIAFASACELLHQASLIHDDLQDEQSLRRNKPSVWGLFGKNYALCAGDLLISAAFAALGSCTIADKIPPVLRTMHRVVTQVIKGQTDDIAARGEALSLAQYEDIVQAKSGALLRLPFDLVVAYVGLAPNEQRHIQLFFAEYALIYQGLDDLDDYESDWLDREALKSPNLLAVMLVAHPDAQNARRAAHDYLQLHLQLMHQWQRECSCAWRDVFSEMTQKISQRVAVRRQRDMPPLSQAAVAIVIGGGIGGIAAALRLRAKGYAVELIERLPQLGGRAQVYQQGAFRHDAGPTVITAPFLLAELFTLFNKNMDDYVELKPIHPWYRFVFADGSLFNYGGSIEDTLREIERFSPQDVAGYLKLVAESKKIFAVGFSQLADKPFHQFVSMLRAIPDLWRLNSHKTVWQFVARYIKNTRLRQAFSIQPLLVGGNPFDTTCIYSLIHYLEREWGVSFPMGGTGALIAALGRLLHEEGVSCRLNTTVNEIVIKQKKARGVNINDGQFIPADLIVSNADTPFCYTRMIKRSHQALSARLKTRYATYSMGLFVLYFGSTRTYPDVAHHTICMGKRYKSLLMDIFNRKQLSDDFSMYLHRPTATDASFAPPGCDSFYVLVPVPNLQGVIDWQVEAPLLRASIIQTLSCMILPDIQLHMVEDFFKTPNDFATDYLSVHGAGFSIAPVFRQSAWFRYHNRAEGIHGLYHVGAGTHPGAGIPGVLSSAKVVDSMIEPASIRREKEQWQ